LSWLLLRGRCRDCGARISLQYPLVELLTGTLFALLAHAPYPFTAPELVLSCVIAALLIAIGVYDLHTTIIPDRWVYTFDLLSFVSAGMMFMTGQVPL